MEEGSKKQPAKKAVANPPATTSADQSASPTQGESASPAEQPSTSASSCSSSSVPQDPSASTAADHLSNKQKAEVILPYSVDQSWEHLSKIGRALLGNNSFNVLSDFIPVTAYSFLGNQALANSSFDDRLKLSEEINDLRRQLQKSVDDLKNVQTDGEHKQERLEGLLDELTAKQKISHVLSRISPGGGKKLLESQPFQQLFKNSRNCNTVVVSIDIRRSTELMLKARTPELFSKFITELSFKLSQIIVANFGIFDKFTGDGILAFFPKFYSGNDAVIRAIKAANECHRVFKDHYNLSKECFNVFIKDVGLGIGIDYGNVTLVNTQSELTVVGIPVVYACRFSGAKAGETLVNQPVKEEILRICPTLASFVESEIDIKHEGVALGYNVSLNEAAFVLQDPSWDELIKEYAIA